MFSGVFVAVIQLAFLRYVFWGFAGVMLRFGVSFLVDLERQLEKIHVFSMKHAGCSAILSPRTVLGKWHSHFQSRNKITP